MGASITRTLIAHIAAALLASLGAAPAHAQPAPPASAFAAPPGAQGLAMAPGGAHFSGLIDTPQGPRLRIYRLTADGAATATHAFSAEESRDVAWTRWASADRLIIARRVVSADDPSDVETRLFAINADGSGRTPLVRPDELTGFVTRIQDDVVDFLPNDPDHILLAFSNMTPQQPDVARVNVRTGEKRRVERGRAGVRAWMTGPDHTVRLGAGATRGGQPRLIARTSANDDRWRNISHRLFLPQTRFEIVGFADEPALAYVLSNHEGDPSGLYLFDLDRESFQRTLYRHATLDAAGVAIAPDGARAQSVRLGAEDGERIWLDETASRAWDALAARFPGRALDVAAESLDGRYLTVRASSPTRPGSYYFYDRVTQTSRYAGAQWPRLAGYTFAASAQVTITARDGADLPAQLLARNVGETLARGGRTPFVIMPHAGPGARDLAGFDPLAQFFAAHGLGVLRVNVRGTGATAPAFDPDGGRPLGQAAVEDVADAAAWLLEEGYADPSQLALAGHGFGAYAALEAAIEAPGFFACVVSLDGVTDLPALAPAGLAVNDLSPAGRHARALWPDPDAARQASPARRASSLRAPVLVAHAREGAISPFTQSLQLSQGLRRGGGAFEFLDTPGRAEDRDAAQAARFIETLDAFLTRCIGPRPAPEAAARPTPTAGP